MSESSAGKHIFIARKARRFPALLGAIAGGRLHLAGACVIAARLGDEGAEGLIEEACGKTRRQIEEIVAARFPRPEVPARIRRASRRRAAPKPDRGEHSPKNDAPGDDQSELDLRPPPRPDPAPEPLSASSYKLTITIDAATREKLGRLVALRRHAVPDGDLATIVSEAISERLVSVEKRRFGARRPRGEKPTVVTEASRPIPAAIRRLVHERDGGRCTYTCPDTGRRCGAEDAIQLHHLDPFAIHRTHDPARITLRCHSHNQYAARQDYGADLIARAISRS